jgi:cell division protein FtsA
MKEKLIVAVDVGSSNVVIAVGAIEDDGRVNIQGIVSEPIEGIDAGCVVNIETAGSAVRIAKERIEKELNIKITEAYAGLSGDFVRCGQVTDYVYVQDELGNQVTESDLEELDRRMRSVKLPDDREEILSMQALCYTIDDKVVDVPVGAYGHVLKATYNFILSDRSKRDRLNRCLMNQGIKVKEFVPNALISHLAIATDEDIEEGVVVVDLGGGVTDVSILHRSKVRHIASIPIGTDSINNDIRTYGIPVNYVENLKRLYGSAVTELTQDDKIVFQSARRGVPKSILRRNLATIIEARLKEIAEWVGREIKEANCGAKFSPILLLTGGGSEMQNIEKLFSRELGIDDVRAVYPEFGFTENMTDIITTMAYSTVASLLLFGANRGTCTIAVGPRVAPHVTPEEQHPHRVSVKPEPTKPEPQHVVEPDTDPEPKKPEPTKPEKADSEETAVFTTGNEEGPKKGRSLWKRLQDKMTEMGNSFVKDNEDEF